jgi:hypothetical protein
MSDPVGALLLVVFATHLPIFAMRWRRSGELRFAATTLTFALLVSAYGLRVFAPDLAVHAAPLHESVRAVALGAAAVSVGLLVRHLAMRARAR